ncbi:hypothetical protein INR49_003077 [Caranx melampygus]|nr:hypothetical protein INR49_003077 [Caranx melampygus]
MKRRRRISPKDDAKYHVSTGKDKPGFDVQHISVFKGRGVFTSAPFEKGDFLLEYQGELISKQECERRQRLYRNSLKVFMFEFKFNGKLWCVDAAKEDGTLGRLVNDDHVNPNAKMKYMMVEGKPHLCLFATRDISPGEEITYDYGDSDWPWRCKGDVEKATGPHHVEKATGPHHTEKAHRPHHTKKADRPHHTEVAAGSQTQTSPVPSSPSRVGKDDVEMADGGPQHTEKVDTPHHTEKVDRPHHTEKVDTPHHTEKVDRPHHTEVAAGSQTQTSPVPSSPSRLERMMLRWLTVDLSTLRRWTRPTTLRRWTGPTTLRRWTRPTTLRRWTGPTTMRWLQGARLRQVQFQVHQAGLESVKIIALRSQQYPPWISAFSVWDLYHR